MRLTCTAVRPVASPISSWVRPSVKQVVIASPEPAKDAAHLSRMIDREVRVEPDGAVAVPSGSDRADFVFITRAQLGLRYPGVALDGLPERGGAGLVIATSDLAAAEKAVGAKLRG